VALIARYPIDDETKQSERRNSLRRRLFALAEPGSVEFDSLYEKVLSSYDPPKVTPLMGNTRSL